MKVLFVLIVLASALVLTGCEKPKKTTGAAVHRDELPPPLSPAQQRLKELTNVIKPGMADEDVLRIAGEPKSARTTTGSKAPLVWLYDLGDGTRFSVRFDKSNRVTIAELDGNSRAQ